MTKHIPDEALLRVNVDLEDEAKVTACITDLLEKNSLSICATQIKPRSETKRVAYVRTGVHHAKSRLGRIMQKLYDLESRGETDKQINVNLDVDLYQMENW